MSGLFRDVNHNLIEDKFADTVIRSGEGQGRGSNVKKNHKKLGICIILLGMPYHSIIG